MQINENTTIRQFLQILGSECLRENLHHNIHVLSTFSDFRPSRPHIGSGKIILQTTKFHREAEQEGYTYPKWILTDCRFPNEAQAIKDRGGIVIRINRLFNDKDYTAPQHLHPSETALDNWNFDWEIDNDDTIDILIRKVREMLLHFGILSKEMINN